jgi:hypothetical protein
MTKHTPGPWAQPEIKRAHNRWHVEGGGRLVAAAGGPQFAIPADEADANARLIASAPDLLAALQRLQQSYYPLTRRKSESHLDASLRWSDEQDKAHDAARTAIAKATGD